MTVNRLLARVIKKHLLFANMFFNSFQSFIPESTMNVGAC